MQDMYKAKSPLYDSDSALATRMQAVDGLSRLLQRIEAPSEGADPDQKELYKQVRKPSCRMLSFSCQHRPWGRAKNSMPIVTALLTSCNAI